MTNWFIRSSSAMSSVPWYGACGGGLGGSCTEGMRSSGAEPEPEPEEPDELGGGEQESPAASRGDGPGLDTASGMVKWKVEPLGGVCVDSSPSVPPM